MVGMNEWRDGSIVGKSVVIQGERRVVVATYPDIPGGIRLDRPIGDFVSWNIHALDSDQRTAGERALRYLAE